MRLPRITAGALALAIVFTAGASAQAPAPMPDADSGPYTPPVGKNEDAPARRSAPSDGFAPLTGIERERVVDAVKAHVLDKQGEDPDGLFAVIDARYNRPLRLGLTGVFADGVGALASGALRCRAYFEAADGTPVEVEFHLLRRRGGYDVARSYLWTVGSQKRYDYDSLDQVVAVAEPDPAPANAAGWWEKYLPWNRK